MEGGGFRVSGWTAAAPPSDGWESIFPVYAGTGDVPMLGSYAVENGALIFSPRFPMSAGVRARAVFHAPGIAPVEAVFDSPKAAPTASTRVLQVYPSTDLLPDNQLKFYLSF